MRRGKFDLTNQKHYPDLGSDASSVYGISALVSQMSFRWKTSGSIAKCQLFSQATSWTVTGDRKESWPIADL